MRGTPGQREVQPLPRRDRDIAHRPHPVAVHAHVAVQDRERRAGNRDHAGAFVVAGDPWNGAAVIEAQREFERHRDLTAAPLDDPDQCRIRRVDRKEIDHGDRPRVGLEHRLQHQPVIAIVARDATRGLVGRDEPAPVLVAPEQRRETGRTVEPRPAQPVDRTVPADQRATPAVADQRVILDGERRVGQTSFPPRPWRSPASTVPPPEGSGAPATAGFA